MKTILLKEPPRRLPLQAEPPPRGWTPLRTRRRNHCPDPGALDMVLSRMFLFVFGTHLVAVLSIMIYQSLGGFLPNLFGMAFVVVGVVGTFVAVAKISRWLGWFISGSRARSFFRRILPNQISKGAPKFAKSGVFTPRRRGRSGWASIYQGRARLREDLRTVFQFFPRENLVHLRHNFHRLAFGSFSGPVKTACLFHILSEPFPEDRRIRSFESLDRHFTDGASEGPSRLSAGRIARTLVSAFDQKRVARYSGVTLDGELLWEAVEEALLADRGGLPRSSRKSDNFFPPDHRSRREPC